MTDPPTPPPAPEPDATLRALVLGRVQGVGFRWFVQNHANDLELTGTVLNTPNGAVEVQACGPRDKLELLVRHLEMGPGMSRVTDVHVRWDVRLKEFYSFRITY